MFLQLLCSDKSLSTLQTSDLIPFRLLVAPAAGVLFVLLEVLLTEKLSQTSHAVNALGFTFVLPVQFRQAEVAVASHACVRQQTEMGEAVFQESILVSEDLCAVCAFKTVEARLLLMTYEGFLTGEITATFITRNIH